MILYAPRRVTITEDCISKSAQPIIESIEAVPAPGSEAKASA